MPHFFSNRPRALGVFSSKEDARYHFRWESINAVVYLFGGAVLFCVASVPYLWSLENRADRHILDTYLAWLFVIGSALFVLGGIFNYWRAWLVARSALENEAEAEAQKS